MIFVSSVKEINNLVSKGMWNLYLKVTVKKYWLRFSKLSPGPLSGAPTPV